MLGKPEFAWHFSGNAWNTVYVCFFCGTDPLIWKTTSGWYVSFFLTLARGGTYIVEQPGSSILRYYHRFDWLRMETTESCLCLAVCIYGNVSILPFIGHKPVSGTFYTSRHSHIYVCISLLPPFPNFMFSLKRNQWFGLPGRPLLWDTPICLLSPVHTTACHPKPNRVTVCCPPAPPAGQGVFHRMVDEALGG